MSAAKLYLFEGEQMTLRQIKLLVSALSISTIQKHLIAGRTTRIAMLRYPSAEICRASAKKSAKKFSQRRFLCK